MSPGGYLEINDCEIYNNSITLTDGDAYPYGVSLGAEGDVVMNGGYIHNNTINKGWGSIRKTVCVGGTFTMNGGVLKGTDSAPAYGTSLSPHPGTIIINSGATVR